MVKKSDFKKDIRKQQNKSVKIKKKYIKANEDNSIDIANIQKTSKIKSIKMNKKEVSKEMHNKVKWAKMTRFTSKKILFGLFAQMELTLLMVKGNKERKVKGYSYLGIPSYKNDLDMMYQQAYYSCCGNFGGYPDYYYVIAISFVYLIDNDKIK
jgi:hypothetical protein